MKVNIEETLYLDFINFFYTLQSIYSSFFPMHLHIFLPVIGVIFRVGAFFSTFFSLSLFAGTVFITDTGTLNLPDTQSDMNVIKSTGSLSIEDFPLLPTPTPPSDMRRVAVLQSDPSTFDSDLRFILGAYFPSFHFDGSSGDDVFSFTGITSISDLTPYSIVIVQSKTFTESEYVPQTILEEFVTAGGIIVQDPLSYSLQQQKKVYPQNIAFPLPTSLTTGDMDYDGSVLWMVEDNTSIDRIVTVDPLTGLIVNQYCAPDTITRSIVAEGAYVYVADSAGDRIYKIDKTQLTPYD
jgi:hypothetical protein